MSEAFLSAILGAIIGGACSIIATFIANKNSRDIQMRMIQEEINRMDNAENLKAERNAGILKIEILSWIELAIFRINDVRRSLERRPDNLDFNDSYRIYLEAIIDKTTFEESQRIMKLYGMAKQISIHLSNHSYVDVNNNTPAELTKACEELAHEVFDEENYDYFKSVDPSLITRDFFVSKLNKEYKPIIQKMNDISRNRIYVL